MAKKTNGMSKQEAVRRALEAMGKDAKPSAMQPFIKEKFGIDMTTDHISTAKGEILRRKKGKKEPGPKPQAAQPARAAPKPAGKAANGISLQDIQAVQGLVGRLGANQLKGLIDLLAR